MGLARVKDGLWLRVNVSCKARVRVSSGVRVWAGFGLGPGCYKIRVCVWFLVRIRVEGEDLGCGWETITIAAAVVDVSEYDSCVPCLSKVGMLGTKLL